MTFSSIPFLFYFLPVFIAFYAAVPAKNAALLAASLVFFAWGEPVHIILLLTSLIANHWLAGLIAKSASNRILFLGVALNLAALAWFKYAGFLVATLSEAIGLSGADATISIEPHLPLGISFYTFQAISLLIDVRRKDAAAPARFIDTALYISMFPQLIAGPIVRYKEIEEQLHKRTHSAEKFSTGARLFILGLAQKVLLANIFAAPADAAFNAPDEAALTMGAAWLGLAAYSLQIYFDFAGYSNMALGMGRMFGFELPRNFNFPYVAQSVTEFWRRWHMTLSRWFRDYLYIPLGGNRGGAGKTYRNLWVVFLLCGLWHGAAWTFVFWGAWHGALLVMERAFLGRWLAAAPRLLRHVYLPLVVALGWVPFRAESFAGSASYYAALFGARQGGYETAIRDIAPEGFGLAFCAGVIAAFWPIIVEAAKAIKPLALIAPSRINGAVSFSLAQLWLAFLFILCAAMLAGGAYNPFIYFRF
ncbi:MBOAT family O-acyltransferase [Hyphococcus sp.]|uniref:MBOAT family O-acyltransferase n=1 Tax=Hyphococcus sp. TaxID=2038636 RepID=UPI00207F1002|nr:MAG: alginate regulatory protein [Marinicaulis sp.]